jgi:hypothetical protein
LEYDHDQDIRRLARRTGDDKSVRASAPSAKKNDLAGGGILAAIIAAGVVAIGVVAIVQDDDSDSN